MGFMEQVEPMIKKVDDAIAQYPSLTQYEKFKELEDKTGYSKVYFFAAGVTLLSTLIFVTGGMKLASNLVGFIYPAYMSFKALEGGKSIDGDATQWMTYWIIFCSIKVFAVIWLYHPKTTGAQVIYSSGVRPYLV